MSYVQCSLYPCEKDAVWNHCKRVGDLIIMANSCVDHFVEVKIRMDKIKSPKIQEGFNDAHVAA